MQAISTILTAEEILLLSRVAVGISCIRTALATYKINTVKKYSILDVSETDKGDFHPSYFFGENEEQITEGKFLAMMSDEKITCVKRCCQSLTGLFPSGILSVVTWMLVAQTVRHEFAIVHTPNYIVLIELTGNNSSCKKGCMTAFRILKARTEKEKEAAEKLFCKKRWYKRDMAVLEGKKLASLGMNQVWSIVVLWVFATRAGGYKYTIIQKNCKSLARTIRYFCEADIDYANVLNSLWGIFTDKPGIIAVHLDAIILEKAILHGSRVFKSMRELREMTIDQIKELREKPLVAIPYNV